MNRIVVHAQHAPEPIGAYSQAIRAGDLVFLSGQIGLDPATMELVTADIDAEIDRVFGNLQAVAEEAGASLADVCRFTIYLTDLAHFARVNAAIERFCAKPYPTRTSVQVAALPRSARVSVDAILSVSSTVCASARR